MISLIMCDCSHTILIFVYLINLIWCVPSFVISIKLPFFFFRALGDQLDGHTGNHLKHRLDTVRYMINHRGHFEPFIDVPFDRYGWCSSKAF